MHSKLHFFRFFLAFVFGFAAIAAGAQAARPATVHGHVADPSGARIPGATVTVTNTMGTPVNSAVSNDTGEYTITGLAPGSYIVEANRSGFAPYASSAFKLESRQSKVVDITMALPVEQQQVEVSSEQDQVSTQAGSNTNAIIIKGKDLDALSNDPDELSNELQALAGPAAGPNGGQIYIDGFTGGQLPPKSAIRQIIVNQNPFSAQFDRLGYGRIEVLTKPGSDKLHGRIFAMGNDGAVNAGNPFVPTLPSYYSYMLNGTLSGPLSHWASYFFSIFRRTNQDVNVYTIQNGPVFDAASNTYSISDGSVAGTVFSPGTRMNISPRLDMQLGQKNTLSLRYQFFRATNTNNLNGTTSLPTRATSSDMTDNGVQADDTQIISNHLVNETRAEYRLRVSKGSPASTAPSFGAPGYFSGGGAGSQFSNDRSIHLELQNFTTLSAGAHAIKFGIWMRDNREAISSNGGFNGSFTFPSIQAFVDTWNGTEQGQTVQEIAAACPTPGACTPSKLTYTAGPTKFTANVYDTAVFYQDDWKVNPFLTVSLGLRWEAQNHVPDHSDFAPRFAFAYALDGHRKGSVQKTVIRGGYGFFYNRFEVGDLMTLEQNNGGTRSQVNTVIDNPTCFNGTSLDLIPGGMASCGSGTQPTPRINTLYARYRSPYTEMLGLSMERQLSKTATLTLTYLHAYGVHQMATINANAYLPGTFQFGSSTLTGVRPNPNLGIVDQFFPQAIFKENQLIVNVRAQLSSKFNVTGFYNASWANSNTGTAENSYNLLDSYGRASFVRPQWLFLMGNYTAPWGLNFSPFLVAQGGRPYNFTSPNDLTGDNYYNNRPGYADTSDCTTGSKRYYSTSYGCLDIAPSSGETLVPYNFGNSPSSFAVNLRLSRSFGIGPSIEGPGGPSRGGFHGRHGGRFGGPFGGGGRGPFGGGGGTGHRYSLDFSAQAMNLFNNMNYGTPVGTVSAPSFGESTGLAGFIFSPRRFFFQTSFQF